MRRGILIGLLFFLIGCQAEFPDRSLHRRRSEPKDIKPVSIQVVSIVGVEVPFVFKGTGKTEASDRFVAKAPQGGGTIERVFVEEGQKIEAGGSLVKFEEEELQLKLDVARSQIEESEAGLEEARYTEKNKEVLLQDGKITQVEADGIDEKISLYEAILKRARNEVELFEKQLQTLEIKSPIAGVVTSRKATEQQKVASDAELVEVVRIEPLHFTFEVPLDVVGTLEPKQPLAVVFPDVGKQEFTGEILSIGAEVALESDVKVKVLFPNETLALKGNMNGEVVINTSLTRKALTIPPAAVEKTKRSAYAYKIDGEKVDRVAITLEEGKEIRESWVVEKGLNEGDIVAISNLDQLKDGVKVVIEENAAP